jgi:peroxiredoxin/N-acetylglutamate synthase-like GNAT family acetyltransferase
MDDPRFALPANLPAPIDDGSASHLLNAPLPKVELPSTHGGVIDLSRLDRAVVFTYPRTGEPNAPMPPEWDAIPGARGCTPQACGFRDLAADFDALGVRVFALSTQTTAYQREFMRRTRFPFPILSDHALQCTRAMRLPSFMWDIAPGQRVELIKRMAWYIDRGVIRHLWYPVFPPDRNATDVLAWLRAHLAPPADIDIVTDPTLMDLDAIHAMIAGTYWSPDIRRDVFDRAIQGSVVVAAVDRATSRTIGFARVVTDKATFAWLCDVVVDDAFKGRGVAKRMITTLDRMPELSTLRRWTLATRDAQSLYEQFGYRSVQGNWLERKNDPSAWKQTPTDP